MPQAFFIVLLILFYCLDYFFRISPSLILPELMVQYHANPLQISSFASAFYLGYALMQIPAGILLDRFPLKRIIIPAIFICTCASICFLYSTNYWLGYQLRLIIGAASSFSFISILFFARHHLPLKYFSLISGLTIAMGTLSASFAQSVSAVLMHVYDWRLIFLILTAWGLVVGSVMLLPLFFFKNPQPRAKPQYKQHELIKLFTNKAIIINGLIGGLFYLPTTLFVSLWGVPFLVDAYHTDKKVASIGITILFLGWAIGAPVMGWFGTQFKNHYKPIALAATFALLTSGLIVMSPEIPLIFVMFLLFLFGLFSSVQVLVWHAFRKICSLSLIGIGTSYVNMLILSQGALFHLIVGYLIQKGSDHHTINFKVGLIIIPIIFAVVVITSIFMSLKQTLYPESCNQRREVN